MISSAKKNKIFAKKIRKKSQKLKQQYVKHKQQKAFATGCSWLNNARWFKVECCWEEEKKEDGSISQDNWKIFWVACRKFNKKEREFNRTYCSKQGVEFIERETEESKYVLVYVEAFLSENAEKFNLNVAYIFPATKPNDNNVQYPLYIRKWSRRFNFKVNEGMAAAFKNFIWHQED